MMNICQSSVRRSTSILSSAIKFVGCTKQKIKLVPVTKLNHWKVAGLALVGQHAQPCHRPISTSPNCSCMPLSDYEIKLGTQIYDGAITKRVQFVKFFSASTSICSLAIIPTLMLNDQTGGFGILGVIAGSMASIMFFTPFFLHYFTKAYVTKMFLNYKTDTYTAFTISFILRDVRHEFHQKDVQVPSVANIFTSFKANGRSFMVDTESFTSHNDYAHLMGYDKMPINILENSEKTNDAEKEIK